MKEKMKQRKNDDDSFDDIADGFRKGLWSVEEDKMLLDYVNIHGKGHWNRFFKETELKRSGKSCRLRWINYLSPSVKRERFTEDEDDLIIRLHNLLGNRWALIAGRVPGRTDNQVKNYWNTHLSKKLLVTKNTTTTQYHHFCKQPSPAIIHNTHSTELPTTDDQIIIRSEFTSNFKTRGSTTNAVPVETRSNETISIKVSSSYGAQKSHRLGGLQGDEFRQTEFADAAASASADSDHGSSFTQTQYLDDYNLHFVLNGNHWSNDAASTSASACGLF